MSGTFAGQRDVITQALYKIPPALDVLIKERPRLTAALNKLGTFSDTATRLVNDAGSDLVRNLKNLEPTISALADIGPDLDAAIAYAPTFPFTQGFIDRYIRGDYVNGYFIIDLTNSGLRKSILRGTHWERLGARVRAGARGPGVPAIQIRCAAGAPGVRRPVRGPLRSGSRRPDAPGPPHPGRRRRSRSRGAAPPPDRRSPGRRCSAQRAERAAARGNWSDTAANQGAPVPGATPVTAPTEGGS